MEIDKKRLIEVMEGFGNKTVAVIGDFCLDEYIYGTADSLSLEAPIPRVIIDSRRYMPGAAGNVACGVRALGAGTYACGVAGSDLSGEILIAELKRRAINTQGMIIAERYTPTYSRVVVGKQHLSRFDLENKTEISPDLIEQIFQKLKTSAEDSDAIIFADYDEAGHGLVRGYIFEYLLNLSKKNKNFLVGISRKRLDKFKSFGLVVMNEKEAENNFGVKLINPRDIEKARRDLSGKLDSDIVLTRGGKGICVFARGERGIYHAPSFATNVVDVTGAGDSLTVMMTLALISGATLQEAGYLGSHAAAVAVGKEGTYSVKKEEVIERINGG